MKTPAFPSRSRRASGARRAAFTLPELMITLTLFLLLVGGILSSHLFGLRMSSMTEAKLTACTSAREALGKLTGEIRSCDSTWVGNIEIPSMGNVKSNTFTEIAAGKPQVGSALLVQPTTNAAYYIIYFLNPDDHTFRRSTSEAGTTTVLARSVTNEIVFYAQDYAGNVLTNKLNNRVIHVSLEFFQPLLFQPEPDYYKIETSVMRRSIE
jgi:prepilin-type N-terminal cleavage/methylation domain-containing protein